MTTLHNDFPQSPLDWYRYVLALAWPVVLSGLTVPLVGLVDTAVMGHLPDPRHIGGVAVGAVIFSSVFWVFGFLRMGTTGFVAQAAGRYAEWEITRIMLRSVLTALVLGGLIICLQWPLRWLALQLMAAEPEVTASASHYFSVRVWSAPFTFVNYVVLGVLFGLQRMRMALLIQLQLNGMNVLLDLLLVWGMGMASAGVALATVISEFAAAVTGLWVLRRWWWPCYAEILIQRDYHGFMRGLFDGAAWLALFRVNRDLFIRTLMLTAAFFYFTHQGAQLGTVILAGNAILLQLLHMIAYGLDGFAHAAEALVGRAHGAGHRDAMRSAVRSSTGIAVCVALLISAGYALLGHAMIGMMTTIPDVSASASHYLPWLIAAPLVAVWSYQFDGIFVGMTRTIEMRNTVALAVIIYVLLVGLLVPVWGNHGLWGSLLLFLLLRGVLLMVLYRQYPYGRQSV